MMHPTHSRIGLVRLGDSEFVPANPEDDLRGKDVCDPHGQRMGSVEDLYVDRQEREVRFLEVGAGGFLGIGERRFLVPVEAVTRVSEDRVTVEPDTKKKMDGPAPFGTKVRPPSAEERRNDDYASLPFGNAEGTVDTRGGYHSSFPAGRRPFL
ncbi:MAG: PRC-barrel domain-containing protein [Actinomycetota bacterium]|nr:PRC-barrel domain-containing protein [Actinomycetota bacterium]